MLDADAADDARTIAQVLAGDREAFGALVARYARRLHDLARRLLGDASEAEDAVQVTFLHAYRALDRFDPQRPFRHWLLRIATNHCRNRWAARRRVPKPSGVGTDDDDRAAVPEPAARPPAERGPDAERERVREALAALPETYRVAAVLRYVHDLELTEIAEVTGDPVATVKTHLHRARAVLRRTLAPSHETDAGRAGTDG